MNLPDDTLRDLLGRLARGDVDLETVHRAVSATEQPHASVRIDHDRERRCGFPEVIFGQGKTDEQLIAATRAVLGRSERVLITRLDASTVDTLRAQVDATWEHFADARCAWATTPAFEPTTPVGSVLVLSAGSSDLAVAEEARVTASVCGCAVTSHYDVGVAGLHRLLDVRGDLESARAIVVVAGMDGALPSVVAGLAACPVIGVPTSVGYGAALGGIAPLLSMLNSCAAGLAVVNIDNGFGAGMLAAKINQPRERSSSS